MQLCNPLSILTQIIKLASPITQQKKEGRCAAIDNRQSHVPHHNITRLTGGVHNCIVCSVVLATFNRF